MDPLKPFSSILRSAWHRTIRRTDSRETTLATGNSDHATPTPAAAPAPPPTPLHARLRQRLANTSGIWDENFARELFVESVLLGELGADLSKDPAFAHLVTNLSRQLAANPQLTTRLDTLLKQLAHARPAG